jgi:hypothetical protein
MGNGYCENGKSQENRNFHDDGFPFLRRAGEYSENKERKYFLLFTNEQGCFIERTLFDRNGKTNVFC